MTSVNNVVGAGYFYARKTFMPSWGLLVYSHRLCVNLRIDGAQCVTLDPCNSHTRSTLQEMLHLVSQVFALQGCIKAASQFTSLFQSSWHFDWEFWMLLQTCHKL